VRVALVLVLAKATQVITPRSRAEAAEAA